VSPTPSPSYARYVLGVMFALTALNVMDRQVLSALAEPVKQEFGLSDLEMGVLLGSAFGFAHVVAMVPAGRLADRWSRRNVLGGGLFLWSALTSLTGLSQAAWHLFSARCSPTISPSSGGAGRSRSTPRAGPSAR
jgi:MFS family permease